MQEKNTCIAEPSNPHPFSADRFLYCICLFFFFISFHSRCCRVVTLYNRITTLSFNVISVVNAFTKLQFNILTANNQLCTTIHVLECCWARSENIRHPVGFQFFLCVFNRNANLTRINQNISSLQNAQFFAFLILWNVLLLYLVFRQHLLTVPLSIHALSQSAMPSNLLRAQPMPNAHFCKQHAI